ALLAWEQLAEALAQLGIEPDAAESAPGLARRAARRLGAGPDLASRLLAAARAADAAAWAPDPDGAGDAGGGPVAEITDLLAEVRAARRGASRAAA
ncbi:MAG TPA: hypothetical protein VFN60_01365, partial [Acidimicrobiales bacterium]|nr:hypothetical protein [Acidimicrobiales bacterium]